ncbi:hypothetical protein JOF35_003846 [Streptomyces demainii]|uniref:Uncharacterized protein n=1 Tax=Streptomyces demainii TaxID=588122 RepID=A0ABT9KT93_9ACTN|nr:hypothetical protein [Streptomyces demainii]
MAQRRIRKDQRPSRRLVDRRTKQEAEEQRPEVRPDIRWTWWPEGQ